MSVEYPRDAVRFDYELPKQDVHKKIKLDERVEVQLVTVGNRNYITYIFTTIYEYTLCQQVASPHSFYFWLHDEEYKHYKGMSYSMQYVYYD